ncbi:hypothetical protein Q5H93_21550 [Hymenobacter sp. ASUV-10]|uniref:Uncharacterized protein n=1 Tax=Hymenobacter aranciens TaxID=3063996 RepID=A0ABT9BHR4_9BACT|nr:hypothetical protein [Hymenobacter sp. ASUV-10]MDO7877345.1 hypothetical protein [Hymenobacter sp. ASUV-10]
MNLPDPRALEDAGWQLDYATEQLAPLVELLELRCAEPPTNPAHRARWEQNAALLRALKIYTGSVSVLHELEAQQVGEMRKEMTEAQLRYTMMGVERDYLKQEVQQLNQRYYDVLDTLIALQDRLPPLPVPHALPA